MSEVERNIALAKESVQHLQNGDLRSMFAGYDKDCVWHVGPGVAEDVVSYFGTWKGIDGLMTCFSKAFASPVQETAFDLNRYYGIDDRVFAFGEASYVDMTTGHEFTTPQYYEMVYRDGKLIEMTRGLDTAAFYQAYNNVDKDKARAMAVVSFYEVAPHIEINQDGAGVTLANMPEPANRNWGYRHAKDYVGFTQTIERGAGPVHEFADNPVDLSSATTFFRGYEMKLEDYLHETHCDGILVLKGNDVVYQDHRRMTEDDLHMIMSSSKTTTCAVIGHLVGEGLIDLQKTVDEYIPDIGPGYKGATIQAVLDMGVPVSFNEDFTDPNCDLIPYDRRCGLFPDENGDWDKGVVDYLKKLGRNDDDTMEDGFVRYVSTNTDLLGHLTEVVTGKPFTQVFQEVIYQHLGAELDATYITDSKGAAVCNGGLSLGLRDFARYAQIFANKGVAPDGTRVFPESWADETLAMGKGMTYFIPGIEYHNQMTTNGESFCHLGIGGQALYANPKTGVVVVVLGANTSPAGGDIDGGGAFYLMADAINTLLS